MATPAVIKDHATGNAARVTEFGQLVVAPIAYSTPIAKSLTPASTVFNFIEPAQDQNIVITDIAASANFGVSVNTPASTTIYQASAPDTAVVDELIYSPQLLRGGNVVLTGLNMLIPGGKWVNAFTDDDIILLTIMYYRVPVEVVT